MIFVASSIVACRLLRFPKTAAWWEQVQILIDLLTNAGPISDRGGGVLSQSQLPVHSSLQMPNAPAGSSESSLRRESRAPRGITTQIVAGVREARTACDFISYRSILRLLREPKFATIRTTTAQLLTFSALNAMTVIGDRRYSFPFFIKLRAEYA